MRFSNSGTTAHALSMHDLDMVNLVKGNYGGRGKRFPSSPFTLLKIRKSGGKLVPKGFSFFTAVKISTTNELSTKSRVMGDCQARFCEKGG